MPKPKNASKRGKRYTAAEKQRILAAAKKEGLTGAEVARRFGVSTLSFYRWRGPARKRAASKARPVAARSSSSAAAPAGSRNGHGGELDAIRREVREGMNKVLATMIREEVSAALAE